MAWDDDKEVNPGEPSGELPSDEWDNHVQDQKNHSTRHEQNGSDELDVSGLSGVLADPQDPNQEAVQDIVGALISGGANITTTYDDGNDVLTVETSALNQEEVEDAVAALVTAGSGITVNYDDPNDSLSIAVNESNLSFYDGTNITANVDNQSVDTEESRIGDVDADERTTEPGSTTGLEVLEQGHSLGEGMRSWAMELPHMVASLPKDRTKARVAFHSDGSRPADLEVSNRMFERGLPWSCNLTPLYLEDDWDGDTRMSLDDAITVASQGAEIGVYSMDYDEREDIDSLPDDQKLDMVRSNKRDLEDMGFQIARWKDRQGSMMTSDDSQGVKSNVIRSTHIMSGHSTRPSHVQGFLRPYGKGKADIEDDISNGDVEAAQEKLDRVIEVGGQQDFFFHANGVKDNLSDLETFLDYVVQKRDDGDLEVGTVLGSHLIPYEFDEINVASDPKANGSAAFDVEDYWPESSSGVSVGTDGGAVGDNYFILPQGDELGIYDIGLGPMWPVAMLEFQAKAPSGETAEVGGIISERNSDFDLVVKTPDIEDTWTTVYLPFGMARDEMKQQLRIRSYTGTCHVDDIKIYPV